MKDGFYTIGQPQYEQRDYGGAWFRLDTYHCAKYQDLDGQRDRVKVLDSADTSPIICESPLFGNDYDARCPCCYLHHGHSRNYHNHILQVRMAA